MIDRSYKADVVKAIRDRFPLAFASLNESQAINEETTPSLTTFEAVEEFIKDKELPFVKNVTKEYDASNSSLGFMFNFVPKNTSTNKEGYTLVIKSNISDYGDESELRTSVEDFSVGIDMFSFVGETKRNPHSAFSSFKEIAVMCDYDRFYYSYKDLAASIVGKRFPTVKYMFDLVESFKREDPETTLGVAYDDRRRKFYMVYNPMFVLEAALEEWAVHRVGYKTFKDCYVYVLGFLIAHEMSHIIRHNTSSNIGTMDVDSISHTYDNSIQDSYINIQLGKLFTDLVRSNTSSTKPTLAVGINTEIMGKTSLKGGFKYFESPRQILMGIDNVIKSVLSEVNVRTNDYDSAPFSLKQAMNEISGSQVFFKVFIGAYNNPLRENSTLLNTVINKVTKFLIEGEVKSVSEGLDKEEKAVAEEVEGSEGLLLGKKVKDKKTGRIGIVVQDTKEGGLKIVFHPDEEVLNKIQAQVESSTGGDS